MNDTVSYSWAFGGPLADAPPEAAWTVLAVVAALGVVFAWSSYRSAVVRLGVAPSFLLMLLRAGCLLTLLFCLANPVRLERTTRIPGPPPATSQPPAPPLVVVIDRSDSMTLPDNRGRTRLQDALATWRRLEKTTQNHFAPPRFYSFAADLKPAASLEEALARTGGTGETRLHQSIIELIQGFNADEKPAALVVLTDGLDTTHSSDAVLRETAVAAGIPVFFVAGTNRSARPEPFLRVREWRSPATVMRNSQFIVEATFEAFSRADRTVNYSVWQGTRRVEQGTLALTLGTNLVPRSFTVTAGEPGVEEFTLRFGDTAETLPAARSVTRILDRRPVRVLVFQGALDWGFRHFTTALRTDPSFEFATITMPEVGVSLARSTVPGSPLLGRLPEDVAVLDRFDCVVLAHPYPKLWHTAQQQALVEFVRRGGSLLLMSPDPAAIPQLAASPLQEILPLHFDPSPAAALTDTPSTDAKNRRAGLLQRLREAMQIENVVMPPLVPFALTDAGRASPIFALAQGGEQRLLPQFAEYVPLSRPKPATEILAVHPTQTDPVSGRPHVLLATLAFGQGRTAVLTTDALWRWKLAEPSSTRVVETFWQQLVLAIGRRPPPEALRFTNAPPQVRVGEPVTLLLAGVDRDHRPSAAAKNPAGAVVQLTVKPSGDADAPWAAQWTPDQPGPWELVALHEGLLRAHAFPHAIAGVAGERASTPPALDALRALASETGGALLTHEPPAAWRREPLASEPSLEPVTSERTFLRWNQWNVLSLALGLLAAELILRRLWKLL